MEKIRQETLEEVEGKIPFFEAGVLQSGDTVEFRKGLNYGLRRVREIIKALKDKPNL